MMLKKYQSTITITNLTQIQCGFCNNVFMIKHDSDKYKFYKCPYCFCTINLDQDDEDNN